MNQNVSVVRDDDDQAKGPAAPAPAPAGSPLSDLQKRIEENRRRRFTDLPVPGVEDIVVRYRAVSSEIAADVSERYANEKREPNEPPPGLRSDAAILGHACVGIFQRIDDRLVSLDPDAQETCRAHVDGTVIGQPVTFSSKRLAHLIGTPLEGSYGLTFRNVSRLYAADGDIHAAARKVMKMSGFGDDDERAPGN